MEIWNSTNKELGGDNDDGFETVSDDDISD